MFYVYTNVLQALTNLHPATHCLYLVYGLQLAAHLDTIDWIQMESHCITKLKSHAINATVVVISFKSIPMLSCCRPPNTICVKLSSCLR